MFCGFTLLKSPRSKLLTLALGSAVLSGLLASPAAAMQTQSYVVNWFTQSMDNEDKDCPGGIVDLEKEYERALAKLGKTPAEIEHLISSYRVGRSGEGAVVDQLMINRGTLNGKPTSVFVNPQTSEDPHIQTVSVKYSRGFNLDGRGAASPSSFEDPITHEKGVNNELFRVTGCFQAFRGSATQRPTYTSWLWTMLKDSMPAWLITVTGEDLSKDGPVTIAFDKALDHVDVNVDGEATADRTFRIDPDPRNHSEFKGEIKGGELSITQPGNFYIMLNPILYPNFSMSSTHLRLKMLPNRNLDGLLGGYQPWKQIYWSMGMAGQDMEVCQTNNTMGLYWLLRKRADGDPDPATGQNRSISSVYRIEAVPVFAVREPDDVAASNDGKTASARERR